MSEQLGNQETNVKEEAKTFADRRRKEERNDLVTSFISVVCVLLLLFVVLPIVIGLVRYYSEYLVERDTIKSAISEVINKGASLDIVKDVYEDRIITHRRIVIDNGEEIYYSQDTPLSKILSDLRVDYYSSQKYVGSDSLYLSRLNAIIEENLSLNPFDNLEESQIQLFKNLKNDIGVGYDTVREDVNKIVHELEEKNKLVSQYLNNADTSLRLSIIALAISLVVAFIQISQGRSSNKKSDAIIKEINQIKEKL